MKWPFKEGDKIGSIFGDGVVKWHSMKTLTIKVEDGREIQLLYDGRLHENDAHPVIWHRETGSPPKVGERPKWKPEKPTLCRVGNGSTPKFIGKRLIITVDDVGRYIDEGGVLWKYVEPVPEDELPYWWPKEWR